MPRECYLWLQIINPTHISLNSKEKVVVFALDKPEEGGSSDVFGSSPACQLAFPWLQDTPDKLCGSKMAVWRYRVALSLQRRKELFWGRSGRGPMEVVQVELNTHSCTGPKSCDKHWGRRAGCAQSRLHDLRGFLCRGSQMVPQRKGSGR